MMFRSPVRRFAVCVLLAVSILCGRAALADVSSIQSLLDGGLRPSAQPALLAPISESGRTGWACKPEKAAEASGAREAELPDAQNGQ
ncbi:MAG: hypothetical protein JO165_04915 [Candidatus Eremiobacteraeota bacterium]|nr:hypothetical protein [Candidatus Eremiobacteraeota bacterium]